mmetsp:Transcript_16460/g.27941  ORF Transcript_16460/g.27941 Transcript_16460/m.27941 type:complete len:185 (+) Transcript_16460:299-853(+)
MTLATIGGVGGGGIAIPMVMGFFAFDMKKAIAISSFSIMITTIARFFYNFGERHPEKLNVTSIDYGMTNVMMPLTLIGSLTGAYVYVSFPELILQILLEVLLIILFLQSLRKGIQIYKKESKELQKQATSSVTYQNVDSNLGDQKDRLINDSHQISETPEIQKNGPVPPSPMYKTPNTRQKIKF